MTLTYMVDVPVFVVAPEIIVWQNKSHHLSTPRNWAMKFHQLPNQLNLLVVFYLFSDMTSPLMSVMAQLSLNVTAAILRMSES